MNRRMCFLTLALMSGVCIAPGALTAAPIVIDDFSTPPTVIGTFTNPPNVGFSSTNTGIPFGNTIGGVREASAFYTATTGGFDVTTILYGSGFGGVFSAFTGGNDPTVVNLTYDGVAGAGLGLNANLASQLGINLEFNILDAATIGSTIQIRLTDGDGDVHQLTLAATVLGAQTIAFPFSSFTAVGLSGPLNLADIDRIAIQVNGNPNSDYTIDNIVTDEAVPEPSTFAMAGMFVTLFGGGLLLRRRSSNCAAALPA